MTVHDLFRVRRVRRGLAETVGQAAKAELLHDNFQLSLGRFQVDAMPEPGEPRSVRGDAVARDRVRQGWT